MPIDSHKRICETWSRVFQLGLVVFTTASLTSCASLTAKSTAPVDYARRIQALEKQLKRKNQQIEDLRERNLVLEHRDGSKIVTASVAEETPSSSESIAALSVPSGPVTVDDKAPVPVVSVPSGENAEHYLYSKVIDTYRTHNKTELQSALRMLLRTYPDSVFADNAIYLSGLLSFELGDLSSAMNAFDQLIKEYPRSNKVVAAMFARASSAKRLGRPAEAARDFRMVRDLFPGSPEAKRVTVELKLLGQATLKRRES